jgi:hypothetical protein
MLETLTIVWPRSSDECSAIIPWHTGTGCIVEASADALSCRPAVVSPEHATSTFAKDEAVDFVGRYDDSAFGLSNHPFVHDDRERPFCIPVAVDTRCYIDQQFTWDAGFETLIVDAIASTTETYAYDCQDRLWSATGPRGTNGASLTLACTYDAKGN